MNGTPDHARPECEAIFVRRLFDPVRPTREGPHSGPDGPAERKAAGPDAARNNRDCSIPSLKDVRHRLSSPSSPSREPHRLTRKKRTRTHRCVPSFQAEYASITACESKQKSEPRERDVESKNV
uniref:Uncharacterized protein n=1 Tax=Anopheles coluzzii TaxID=1518534 RepID=A0A8W7PZI7_ANOCL